MGDNQRIHPLHHDVESPPSPPPPQPLAPLVPRNMSRSDKGDPELSNQQPPPPPPPPARNRRSRRGCCCKFLCWFISILLIVVVAIGATVGILYLVFRPKLPKYSINEIGVTRFDLSNNDSLSVTFNLTITARNPNKRIGIDYRGGSHISAYYNGTKLCDGSLPKFYQGHHNTTVLNIPLSGEAENATALENSLTQQLQQSGSIPLRLKAKQPVRIKFGKLKLFKITFRVRCWIVVDNLNANNSIRIKSSSCKFRLKL
ncbi:hypothetical protein S245_058997 [Arachis hypogaea]|uniref:Late embryogenesis abundant protein LEA-2 subgroup domain-containing protein n=2 Tax=Arachis hypogaea TaxID=3818 RepID=A0A444YBX8_ARAHY|nr:Putative syntaxin [Arachis hypogaea]RYQ99432.1 hypothetical protein Ahy_B07g087373 isoform A [Arachis hypogaea]